MPKPPTPDRRKFNRGTVGNRGGRPPKRRTLVMDGIIQDGHWRVVSVNDETIVIESINAARAG